MCVIIHQPTGTHLDKERAKRLWAVNSDGGGFAYVSDTGAIEIEKYMAFSTFWRNFEQARSNNPNRDFVLHMRIATHGTVCLDNVHPFVVNDDLVMAHNGIIRGVPDYNDGRSDTRVFIDEVLPELPEDWLDKPYLVSMVEEWIGWSKLLFLNASPKLQNTVYILNEHTGETADGMWFSNSHGVHPKKEVKVSAGKGLPTTYRGGYGQRTGYTVFETSEDWEAFEARTMAQQTSKEAHTYPGDIIKDIRSAGALYKPTVYDTERKEYMCLGCDEDVDMVTGECECYNKICNDCERFAGECVCHAGYSNNLVLFSNASERLQVAAISE